MRCRGGFTLEEMSWSNGTIDRVQVLSTIGGKLRVRSAVPLVCEGIDLKPLKSTASTPGMLLDPQSIRRPLISPEAPINTTNPSAKSYVYDIETTPGQVYVLMAEK